MALIKIMTLIKKIPAVKTFDLPAGTYQATLTQIKATTKQARKGPQEWVRLIFDVEIPEMCNQLPCAGRNFVFDLNPGSDLRNFLEVWLGSDYFKARSNQDFDIETLVGLRGDIKLSHYLGGDNSKPFVNIDNVFPIDSLRLTEPKPQTVAPSNLKNERLVESKH